MAKLLLKNIIASDNVILFDTNDGLKVGHVESSASINPLDSFEVSGDTLVPINNVYPLSSFTLQSYQYDKIPSQWQNNIDDFLDIYGPATTYLQGCQYFNYGYLLSDLTDTPITANTLGFSGDIFSTPYVKKTDFPVNTYVYPSSSIIVNSPAVSSSTIYGEYTCIPMFNLSGIKFNYINECPLEFKYAGFNIDSTSAYNYLYSDTINAKNSLNYNYSLNSQLTSSTYTSAVSATLSNARDYLNIKTSGDLLYMVYKANKYYNTDGAVSLSSNTTGVTYGMNMTSGYAISGRIIDIPMSTMTSANISVYDKFDNVEVLYSINRVKEQQAHKSNLFSINIQNANINNSSLSDTEKITLKRNLTNILETMIKHIVPANTQLFKIYWNGQ